MSKDCTRDEIAESNRKHSVFGKICQSDEFKSVRNQATLDYFQISNIKTKVLFNRAEISQIEKALIQWAEERYPNATESNVEGFVNFVILHCTETDDPRYMQVYNRETTKNGYLSNYFREHITGCMHALYVELCSDSKRRWQDVIANSRQIVIAEIERFYFNEFMPDAHQYLLRLNCQSELSDPEIVLLNMEMLVKRRIWLALTA